ncbi:MAG: hypothetical protein M2R45_05442 [Verrucomicrobia subdivision 3 bacterium]|nr:hypothetical protein [Limisphaerales bacterium]MCS1417792.1 hypothetical protein [Limisphaerales bacterium]
MQKADIKLSSPVFRKDGNVKFSAAEPSGLRFKLQFTTDLVGRKDIAEFTSITREIRIVNNRIAETSPKVYRLILIGKPD